MTNSQISAVRGFESFSAPLAALHAAIDRPASYSSLPSGDPDALKGFLANELQLLRPLAETRAKRAKRVVRLLGLHRLYHEIKAFVETDTGVLISYLFHQAEMFLKRGTVASQDDISPQITAAVDRLQQRLQVKSHRLHQQPCYSTTTAKRAALVSEYLTPKSKVLCLGDDDFVSIALSMMVGNEITVLDLDTQVISLIEEMTRHQHLRITTHVADICRPLPRLLIGAFDVVVTDPIYFVDDMIPFLSAAEQCLRKSRGSALLSCCSRALAGQSWQVVEAWAASRRLAAEKYLEGFNEYPKPARTQALLLLAERLVCRTPLTRACASIPNAYSDIMVFRFQN